VYLSRRQHPINVDEYHIRKHSSYDGVRENWLIDDVSSATAAQSINFSKTPSITLGGN